MFGKGYREYGEWVFRFFEGKNEFCMYYVSLILLLVVVFCKNMNSVC